MMRTAISVLVLALGLVPAAAQNAPRLKPQAIVASDVVRIGDLIENAGVAASTPIFRAPDLGQTGAVPARARPTSMPATARVPARPSRST